MSVLAGILFFVGLAILALDLITYFVPKVELKVQSMVLSAVFFLAAAVAKFLGM